MGFAGEGKEKGGLRKTKHWLIIFLNLGSIYRVQSWCTQIVSNLEVEKNTI